MGMGFKSSHFGSYYSSLCNNCGKPGHQFHQCKLPITSYGIILYQHTSVTTPTTPTTTAMNTNSPIQFLMMRRKNSFGYIDFVRGKYTLHNLVHLQRMIDEMSLEEKEWLLTESFASLLQHMWGPNVVMKNDEFASMKKFELLKQGIFFLCPTAAAAAAAAEAKVEVEVEVEEATKKGEIWTLSDLIRRSTTQWVDTEWEFPKGRRNCHEKDIHCAIREFEEETGILQHDFTMIENVLPFEELFIGSNHKSYQYKYFLGYCPHSECLLDNFQQSEVSKIEWKSLDECLQCIRPYHVEKKKMIARIYHLLTFTSICIL